MEIQENLVLKSLTKNLEICVDSILSKHSSLDNDQEVTEGEFEEIVQEVLSCKEIDVLKQKFFECQEFADDGADIFLDQFDLAKLYDESKLEEIIHQLGHNKSIESRKECLESLQIYTVLDLMVKTRWAKLSKLVRECFLARNKEVFNESLKLHVKLSNSPQAIMEATANLLKTLSIIFQSKKIQSHTGGIDSRNLLQEQIMKIVNLLLTNFRNIFKNLNLCREKLTESIINNFLQLATIHTTYDRTDCIHFMHYIFVLDPEAKWFTQLVYTVQYRKLVMSYCIANTSFMKYICKEFMSLIPVENDFFTSTTWKNEIPLDIIKYSALKHSSRIISTLMMYKWGLKLFPIELKCIESRLCPKTLSTHIINAIQSLNNVPKQKEKRNILCEMLTVILTNNNYLLYNKDVSYALIKPFILKMHERQRLSEITRRNLHVLQIINEISNTKEGIFIIFGFTADPTKTKRRHQFIRSISLQEPYVISTFIEKFRRKDHSSAADKDTLIIGKVIAEFTTNFIRHQTNIFETVNQIDFLAYELLECCCNIHALHTHVMFLINSQRLLESALHLYKIMIDQSLLLNGMNPLLQFFITICATRIGTECFLKQDTELLYILCKHYFYILDDNLRFYGQFSMFLINLASTIPGCIAIAECKRQIINPYLNRIWKLNEDEMVFLSGSNRVLEEEIFKYIRFIFTLQFNYNCIHALLSQDSDDESTVVAAEDEPSSLKDLIDETLNSTGPGTLSCYVGLQTIRMIINNLDCLLFLERAANLENEIEQLQSQCTIDISAAEEIESTESETSVIIDECSLLRRNIVNYIQTVGSVTNEKKPKSRQVQRRLNDFQRFLHDSRSSLHDHNWLLKARSIFKHTCKASYRVCNENVFVDLLQQVRLTYSNTRNNYVWPESDSHLKELFAEDYQGIMIIIRFGKRSKIFPTALPYEEILSLLLKQVYAFLNIDRQKFDGFDWFVGVIFLICGGNIEKSKIVLQCLTTVPIALYIWPAYSKLIGKQKNFDFEIHFDHNLNILIGDLEIFKPALEKASISWNFMLRNWIHQCFFNVLEWNELCNFIAVSVLFPVDYILFFSICCAQHLEPKLLNAITTTNSEVYQNVIITYIFV